METRPQRIGPSNCLAKTQVYAKPKGEVYGLTPARCWKVKGSAQESRGLGDVYKRQAQIITPFVRVGTYPTRNFATLGPL